MVKGRITLEVKASHLFSLLVDLVILGLVLQVKLVHLTVVLSFSLEQNKNIKFLYRLIIHDASKTVWHLP